MSLVVSLLSKCIIIGPQGSGKSLLGLYWSLKLVQQHPKAGITIYTNMTLNNSYSFIKTVYDLSEIPFDRSPKILIVDEAMFTIDSRNHSSKQNKVWTRAQAFFRKANFLLVFFLTHSVDLIDNRMRQQLDFIIFARKNKVRFEYLCIDSNTLAKRPFYLPKEQKVFDLLNQVEFDTYDFPPPILVDGLSDNVVFKIAK